MLGLYCDNLLYVISRIMTDFIKSCVSPADRFGNNSDLYWEVASFNLDPKSHYLYYDFSYFSWVPPNKCRNSYADSINSGSSLIHVYVLVAYLSTL